MRRVESPVEGLDSDPRSVHEERRRVRQEMTEITHEVEDFRRSGPSLAAGTHLYVS